MLSWPAGTGVFADGFLDELLGQFGGFPMGDHPAGDVAAEDVEDDVEIEVGPLGRPQQLGDVPAPKLVGCGGQQLGSLVRRVHELIAALAGFSLFFEVRYMVRVEQKYWPSSSKVACTAAGERS